jgi:hypothetical protein
VNGIVIYESLTGNTKRASVLIAEALTRAGVRTTTSPITNVNYQALHEADLVIVGTWTDGMIFIGQRPGRAGRLKTMPAVAGKQCVVFITYAIDSGRALEKLQTIVEDRGGDVIGGMAIRRDNIPAGSQDFVDRLLEAVST